MSKAIQKRLELRNKFEMLIGRPEKFGISQHTFVEPMGAIHTSLFR
jgi:hypothetical protein